MPEASSTPPLGFLGLGTMGGPMAGRLLSAGHSLVVYNRDRSKADPFVAAGASRAESPRELGRRASSGLVFVMVTDVRAVRALLFGRDGLARGAGPGTLVVNLSTIAPEESRGVGERLGRRGIRYLEAPVAGSLDAAKRGELVIFAGGEPVDLATARPYLERFARVIEHLGPVGAGAAMKLANNLVMVATLTADAEAIAFGEALGLDAPRVIDLLLAAGGSSRALESKREAFVRRDYAVRFKLSLADKDLRLVGETARRLGLRAPIAREAKRLADEAMAGGWAENDLSAMIEAARGRKSAAHAADTARPG